MGRQPRIDHTKRIKTPRKKSGLDKFCRWCTLVLASLVIIVCFYLIAMKASRPFIISYAESKEITDIKRQNAAAEAENKKLKEDRAYLQTAQGKEAEARKLGFVKEGEISLIVEHPEKSEPPVLNPPPPPVKKTFWQKVADKAATVFAHKK